MTTLKTERLILRPWCEQDLEPFAKLNADPRVMEYFPATLSKAESDQLAGRIKTKMDEKGWGIWAVSVPGVAEFIGFIGLNSEDQISFPAPFTPAVEVGWRIAFEYWGKGYATEGAKAALAYGFETLNLGEIVSFTAVQNMRSRRVMERIGMHHDQRDDFDHPKLAEGHPLRKHVLYRLSQEEWQTHKHQKQKYVYKPYSKIFPELFQKERARISASLRKALAIEHVGSTAIPGLGGKGIIDIAIAVAKEEMERSSIILQKLGFQFRPSFSTPDRFYFIAYLSDPEEGSRRYHIHLTYPSSKEWKELIGFRDYLLSHPEAVTEYAQIKKQAASEANQIGTQYRKLKEPIFEKVLSIINEQSIGLVELVNESNLEQVFSFLSDNENFSLFLLGNLEAHGPKLTTSPNSGNFKLIRCEGQIVAVFSLTRRGNLVVQSSIADEWVLEKILDACREEYLPILGLLGEWSFCQKFWSLLKQKGIIQKEIFVSKEILYTVDLSKAAAFNSPNVRLLVSEDFYNWKLHRLAYLKEEGLPNDLSQEQLHELFLEKVKDRISWGYFEDHNLVSMAELNAKAKDLGQVGGVYTTLASRKQGFAQAVMRGIMKDARDLHKIRKLIIFTGETNIKARRLYESLDVHPVGYYALMFGEG